MPDAATSAVSIVVPVGVADDAWRNLLQDFMLLPVQQR